MSLCFVVAGLLMDATAHAWSPVGAAWAVAALGGGAWFGLVELRAAGRGRRRQVRLERRAYLDALTGLPNRSLLREHGAELMARNGDAEPPVTALLLLDLDDFKVINDSLGHAMGDTVLTAVGERLRQAVRASDLAVRLHGDEFAVLLTGMMDAAGVLALAERVTEELRRPMQVGDHAVCMRASAGLALRTEGHSTVEDMLGDADVAMYAAKERAAGTVVLFHPDQRAALAERAQLQQDLGMAVERGELLVHYQPQIDITSGRTTAVEALVRWQHPTRGNVPPDVFIPLAEQVGTIRALDTWVLDTACAQLAAWVAAGLPISRIAVNPLRS